MSYYTQDGDNAAVTGGLGTEELTDLTPTIVVSVPLNDDDVLTIDAGISAYTSASSSNVNPFDGDGPADPFVASTGASESDVLATFSGTYSHSSDDRNSVWSANLTVASEYDYFSLGFGGSYTRLFNEKNTEVSIKANAFLDTWNAIYPSELRSLPSFVPFDDESRNSYSVGLGFSQILSKKLQGSLSLDLIQQEGLLSTPFQRVQFADVQDVIVQQFTYADDIERLPDSRFKIAVGGRLHYYLNEIVTVRTFYRYYSDDWGINSHTASIEIPIKISDKLTIYPSYRFYTQTAADYFAAFNQHLSIQQFYTSDYDLSDFDANQYGFGLSYTDIFTKLHIWKLGLKSIDLRFRQYERDSGLSSSLFSGGFNFIVD
ncbi:DUF3570 domain-containing protein [Aquimarina mytili]|uniref:DUF3570 domain-containing protein n=2 Tax=Aquimarina mytili TaxID=874423 RepID=A0A937DBS8_9FLAO|nr:DUF3570 domain-containing protein [Aquimarina mytili]